MKTMFITAIFLFSCCHINAQTLTGIVYDKATNQPISDVYVFIGGTSIVDFTEVSGKFSLTIRQLIVNAKLVFSHIAYNTLIIDDPFNNLPDSIFMEEQMNTLDEVTVSARRRNIVVGDTTNSIGNVINVPELMKKHPYNSLSEMLKGQLAGVNIYDSGAPYNGESGGVRVRIRGLTSFGDGGTNEPLVVVDGMPVGTLNDANSILNVNNIKSIEVIKNGAGWGSRGAFGVILIKTK